MVGGMDVEEVRRFALSLPEATEEPHFESASFRIRGRIFATLPPDGEHLHVFVDQDEARAVAAGEGPAFEELWWGEKLAGARVHLPSIETPDLLVELIEDAWRRKAPKRVVAAFDADRR
ncbi:MAG: hypothetical protein QOE93_1021 [Actinomycetota bacterium]|jgi:hypothetical protein|nr:hypothetical protein [Actinomycetota bacterium]